MKVLLDTNFLIDIFKFKPDTTELMTHQLYTITPVVEELKSIASSKVTDSKYAKLALQFVEKINIIECSGEADTLLLKLSKDFAIATNDTELRKKLKEKNVKIIYLRAKKKLII